MKGKCKYCKIPLKDESNIRCDKCNVAWEDGYYSGRENVKEKLRVIFRAFKVLCE